MWCDVIKCGGSALYIVCDMIHMILYLYMLVKTECTMLTLTHNQHVNLIFFLNKCMISEKKMYLYMQDLQ